MKSAKIISIIFVVTIASFGITSCQVPYGTTTTIPAGVTYINPPWAPPYVPGARYYYLPDMEVYYDLANQDFVYLDNGLWLFSRTLPPIYSGYDLYSGFVITLDFGVYQPWRHHHYYLSHYPRYYYKNFYNGADVRGIRGFNENGRRPLYLKEEEKNRSNELRNNSTIERRQEFSREPQRTNYYGKNIGRPVRVQQRMKEGSRGGGRQGRH